MRVRGLKRSEYEAEYAEDKLHPMRVRGLKHRLGGVQYWTGHVAPRAGAWIETREDRKFSGVVAPRAGAWIETW